MMNSERRRSASSCPVDARNLRCWCAIPAADFLGHPDLRVRYRQVADSAELGALMARELVEAVEENNQQGRATRAIIPCGPACWYEPFRSLVNARGVSLKALHVFHMDEMNANLTPPVNSLIREGIRGRSATFPIYKQDTETADRSQATSEGSCCSLRSLSQVAAKRQYSIGAAPQEELGVVRLARSRSDRAV